MEAVHLAKYSWLDEWQERFKYRLICLILGDQVVFHEVIQMLTEYDTLLNPDEIEE